MTKHISWSIAEQKKLEEIFVSEYSVENIWQHIEFLTMLHRIAGTDDELKAAQYIKSKLDEYGVESEIFEFDAYISQPGKAELEIISPVQKSISCLPRIFIASTPPGGLEAELVSVGKGSDESYQKVDAKGKIVLVVPGAREGRVEASQKAEEMGAAAQIHITRAKSGAITYGQARSVWGNPTPETLNKVPKTPAVAISMEDGSYLEGILQKSPVVAKLKASASRGFQKIRIPVGKIRGQMEPDKYVMVAGHYCSWFIGATDNSAANALMLEMARIFAKHRQHLTRGVRFAWWSGHEQGTYAGSTGYLDTHWDDIRDNAIAYLVMDGIGRKGASGFDSQNTEEIREFHELVIKDVLGFEAKSKRVPKIGDQSYLGIGLPSFTGKPGFSAKHTNGDLDPVWYGHTIEDTLDKLDMNLVIVPFKVNAACILRMCTNPILPFDFIPVAEMFEKTLNELQKESALIMNLTPLIAQTVELKSNILRLHKFIEEILDLYVSVPVNTEIKDQLKKINTVLMELGRTLMPVLATKAGKYGQDPMGTKYKPIPILQSLEKLNSTGNVSEEYRALQTLLVRERNKVSDALKSANRVIENIFVIV